MTRDENVKVLWNDTWYTVLRLLVQAEGVSWRRGDRGDRVDDEVGMSKTIYAVKNGMHWVVYEEAYTIIGDYPTLFDDKDNAEWVRDQCIRLYPMSSPEIVSVRVVECEAQ